MESFARRWRQWAAGAGVFAVALASTGALAAHPFAVRLKDGSGNAVDSTSTVPYSPEQSCGGFCHDIDRITQGYHFQQGRTAPDASGSYVLRVSDSFNPVKDWLLSDGMYGKT